jgi:chaperone protein EcpD
MHFLTRCFALASLSLAGLVSANAQAGIVLSGTRVIYPAADREVTVSVTNNDAKAPRLVQAWIDSGDATLAPDKADVPFHVKPPVFRLDPQKSQALRIVYTKEPLPADKESVFWLNVLEVPPKSSESGEGNSLQFAFRTRVKLFFRPGKLSGSPEDAPKALTWALNSEHGKSVLTVSNPTPYYISFQSVELAQGGTTNEAPTDLDMVAPFGTLNIPLKDKASASSSNAEVRFKTINDFGGFVPFTAQLK